MQKNDRSAPGSFSIDTISADAPQVKGRTPILRAVGTQLVSLTKRALRDPSLRQTPARHENVIAGE